MSNTRAVISKEVNKLTELLIEMLAQMEQITKLRFYLDQLEGVEKNELQYLIRLCEGSLGDEIYYLKDKISYLNRPRLEGTLYLAVNGRYRLDVNDHEFTCGSPIEIYDYDDFDEEYRWLFGRVEYADDMGGYYFTGDGKHRLAPGMKAATRGR